MKKPIRHKFRPDALHPIECALCGNREDAHEPKPSEPLTAWQKRVKR